MSDTYTHFGEIMDEKRVATPERIGTIIRMFPLETQVGILFGNEAFGPHTIPVPGEQNGWLIMNTPENKQKGVDFIFEKSINHAESIGEIFFLISKPNRLQVFDLINNMFEIPEPEYSHTLKWIWITTEFPHQHAIPKIVRLFNKANKAFLMEDGDNSAYAGLPEKIHVYRGLIDKRAKKRGLSWTTKFETAKWFSKRFASGEGKILEADVNKKFVLMFTNERKEYECVVNPRGLKNVGLCGEG